MQKTTLLLAALVVGIAFSLSACGQRVAPQPPEGKVVPSNQY